MKLLECQGTTRLRQVWRTIFPLLNAAAFIKFQKVLGAAFIGGRHFL